MGGQFKDASAQNGCRAIHLLLEKTTGCQVPLNIHPSIRPSIHPSIYLSISLQDPPNRGVGGTRALAHSIYIYTHTYKDTFPKIQKNVYRLPFPLFTIHFSWLSILVPPAPARRGVQPYRHGTQRAPHWRDAAPSGSARPRGCLKNSRGNRYIAGLWFINRRHETWPNCHVHCGAINQLQMGYCNLSIWIPGGYAKVHAQNCVPHSKNLKTSPSHLQANSLRFASGAQKGSECIPQNPFPKSGLISIWFPKLEEYQSHFIAIQHPIIGSRWLTRISRVIILVVSPRQLRQGWSRTIPLPRQRWQGRPMLKIPFLGGEETKKMLFWRPLPIVEVLKTIAKPLSNSRALQNFRIKHGAFEFF